MRYLYFLCFFVWVNISYSQYYIPKKAEKIMFVDTEYILEKIPKYKLAKAELDKISQAWQAEIDNIYEEIKKLEIDYSNERMLLTHELIEEREKEIKEKKEDAKKLENKYFGPAGELLTKKFLLIKPLQDLIFTTVQEIAKEKEYDYVFDKAGDLLMLYYNPKLDISDMVLKRLKEL